MIWRSQDYCKHCARYRGEQCCEAFPEKIPAPLWNGEIIHHEPYQGDHGLRYVPVLRGDLPLPEGW
jgi:hypothetical protein